MRVFVATTFLYLTLASAWAAPALAQPDTVVHGLGGSGGRLEQGATAVHEANMGESTAGPEASSADGQVRLVSGFASALLTTAAPEPGAGLQWLCGLAGTVGLARRRTRRARSGRRASRPVPRTIPNRPNGE